jgi:membrane associated rhomboid family serine protease
MVPAAVGYQCPDCARGSRQEYVRPAQLVSGRGITLTNVILLVLAGVYGLEVVLGGPRSLLTGPSVAVLVRMGASVGYACTRSGELIGIAAGQPWRLATAMFLHAGLLHLAMNAYALWAFGNVVEAELGRSRFLVIFLVGGLFASAASFTFGEPFVAGVGASGAIFAVLGAFAGYAWRRRELALYSARIRNVMVLILLNAFFAFSVPTIDWRAHAGGLVAGAVMGLAADGLPDRSAQRASFTAATIGLVAIGAVMVLAHSATLQQLPGC